MSDKISSTLCLLTLAAGGVWFVVKASREEKEAEAAITSDGPIRARVGREVVLYDDPLRISVAVPGAREYWELTADTRVTVEVAGEITAVRGRNLAAKAVGGLATGGLGLFVFGNAKTREIDNRELYLTIESQYASHVAKLAPTLGVEARQFAASVNRAARQLGANEDS